MLIKRMFLHLFRKRERVLIVCWHRRPYPVVNVIADKPSDNGGAASVLTSAHKAEQEQEKQHTANFHKEKIAAKEELASINAILRRLSSLHVLAEQLRG